MFPYYWTTFFWKTCGFYTVFFLIFKNEIYALEIKNKIVKSSKWVAMS